MSLLMDALKRAELAKQRGLVDPASDLSMDPVVMPESGATRPPLPKLEDLDAEFIAHANSPTGQTQATEPGKTSAIPNNTGADSSLTPRAAADRRAVRNAFAAKSGMGGERKAMVVAAGLGLLAVGGMGAYLWFQLKPQPPAPMVTKPPAGLAAVQRNNAPPQPKETFSAPERAAPPAANTKPTRLSQPVANDAPLITRRAASPLRSTRPSPLTLPETDTSIQVTSTRSGIEPAINEGYRLLVAGDLVRSRAAYVRVLRSEPRHADALHGIAAIALREGRTEEAANAYQRILESNPSDSAAQAGLIGLNIQGDPVAGESRIKSLIAAQGELPVLNFALGNLYARQQRWNDAQQAYFKAVSGDTNNPDYLFNLAVSLDQLHQPKVAAQYYGQALAAAESHSAAFDRKLVTQRLLELQP